MSFEIATVEKPKPVRKSRKPSKPSKKTKRLPPRGIHRKRPASVLRPISNIAVNPEAAQKLSEALTQLKELMTSTPGFMKSLGEILIALSIGQPDVGIASMSVAETFMNPEQEFTIETCTHILRKLTDVMMQAGIAQGREEVMKEYALECLSKCGDIVESEPGASS